MNIRKVFKVSLLFTVTLCLLLISGCSSSPGSGSQTTQGTSSSEQSSKPQAEQTTAASETKASETQAAKPAQSAQYKITVTPPAGWEPVPGSTALAQYMKGGSSFIVTSDIIPAEAKEPDNYVDFVKGEYQDSFKEVSFESTKNVTIAGMEGRELTYSCTVSELSMKFSIYYVLKDGRAYTFTCASMADTFDGLKGDFEAFMNSVKFQ